MTETLRTGMAVAVAGDECSPYTLRADGGWQDNHGDDGNVYNAAHGSLWGLFLNQLAAEVARRERAEKENKSMLNAIARVRLLCPYDVDIAFDDDNVPHIEYLHDEDGDTLLREQVIAIFDAALATDTGGKG